MKYFHINFSPILLVMSIFFCFPMQVIGQRQSTDTCQWHPKEFHIIYSDMKLTFKLPYEKDRSGVRNLLLQCKKTNKIHLLDEEHTIYIDRRYNRNFDSENYDAIMSDEEPPKYFERFYTKFDLGNYNAILLYNNGTYIKYDDIVFEKNACKEIDMTKSALQPSNSESKYWLTMRAFNDFVGWHGTMIENYKFPPPESCPRIKIRGYIFSESGYCIPYFAVGKKAESSDLSLLVWGEVDGYFDAELCDASQALSFQRVSLYFPLEINVTVDCGLFIVLKETPEAKKIRYYGSNH